RRHQHDRRLVHRRHHAVAELLRLVLVEGGFQGVCGCSHWWPPRLWYGRTMPARRQRSVKPASTKREKSARDDSAGTDPPRLRVPGGFEARRGTGPAVSFSAKKPAALLCYLAFHAGAAQSRDALAALLWEERGHEQARGSLRQALTALRKLLPPGALEAGVD